MGAGSWGAAGGADGASAERREYRGGRTPEERTTGRRDRGARRRTGRGSRGRGQQGARGGQAPRSGQRRGRGSKPRPLPRFGGAGRGRRVAAFQDRRGRRSLGRGKGGRRSGRRHGGHLRSRSLPAKGVPRVPRYLGSREARRGRCPASPGLPAPARVVPGGARGNSKATSGTVCGSG